jgi:hypothetical protein
MDCARGSLLVEPGEDPVSVVPGTGPEAVAAASKLIGAGARRWPAQYQLDAVIGPNGAEYRFDIWSAPGSPSRPLEVNVRATVAAHPLNEARNRLVMGPALLVPRDGGAYTLEDWVNISRGTWALDCYCGDPGEECQCVTLVDRNAVGPSARKRD